MKYSKNDKFGVVAEPNCVDECLSMITSLAVDYDGMDNSVENMRKLVDEIAQYACEAREFLMRGHYGRWNPSVIEEEQHSFVMSKKL